MIPTRSCIAVVLVTSVASAFAAETYKWVDDKGVVNYGEKPPANRAAKPVNTEPTGVIETGTQKGDAAPARQPEEARRPPPQVIAVPVPVPSTPAVRGMEFDTFIRLQAGMSEGELLVRAGPPDHQALDNFADYDRTYYYFP